ncbi:BioY family transporter [Terrihabitans soli]|uniref:Biotin transporter n=1 Tax=Terrihabitans soli TaxID=708113 RepID=A0A6S6QWR9_9HYPH|nr:biotin transporter BioY [Terrihabitans soli]BCJ91480.1 BioY family transporter [Terrihabitans soli]
METRDLVRIALFAAVIGALGLLPKFDLPFTAGVPITAQSLGVMLAGIFLGPRRGALAVLLFLFIVALGMPLLAGGRGGLGPFFAPSAGFLIGFVPGAFVAGLVMERLQKLPLIPAAIIAAILGGIVTVYAFGIPVLAAVAKMDIGSAALASMVFVPGDLLKAVVAGLVTEAVFRAAPQAFAGR